MIEEVNVTAAERNKHQVQLHGLQFYVFTKHQAESRMKHFIRNSALLFPRFSLKFRHFTKASKTQC